MDEYGKDEQAVADLIDLCFTDEYAAFDFYGIEGVSHTVVDGIRVFDPSFRNKDFYAKDADCAECPNKQNNSIKKQV